MGFFGFMTALALGVIGLIALMIVLIAMPNSRFRDFAIQIVLWLSVLVSAVLVISPVDFLPLLPIDDIFVGAGGLGAAAAAIIRQVKMKGKAKPVGGAVVE